MNYVDTIIIDELHEAFMRGKASLDDEFAEYANKIAELTVKLESEKKHREYAYKEANKFIEVNGKLAKNVRLLTTRVDELTAERDEWQAKAEQAELAMNAAEAMWTNADTERERYRELLSKAIRYAHEIVNLQP